MSLFYLVLFVLARNLNLAFFRFSRGNPSFWKFPKSLIVTDGRTDGRTGGRADGRIFRRSLNNKKKNCVRFEFSWKYLLRAPIRNRSHYQEVQFHVYIQLNYTGKNLVSFSYYNTNHLSYIAIWFTFLILESNVFYFFISYKTLLLSIRKLILNLNETIELQTLIYYKESFALQFR